MRHGTNAAGEVGWQRTWLLTRDTPG